MRFNIPVRVSRREAIVAVPGAVLFSRQEVVDQERRRIAFRFDDVKPFLKEIRVNRDVVGVVALDGGGYEVWIRAVPQRKTVQEKIEFVWDIDGDEYVTEVPLLLLGGA